MPLTRKLKTLLLCSLSVILISCGNSEKENGPVVIRYWEKWNGFEADAMRLIVDDFNASQDEIFVEYSSVSQIDRRLMLAIAGGIPPDVAGLWNHALPVYAENNALTPLNRYTEAAGIGREDYISIYWDMCTHRNYLWALPSTPASTALIYNKKMFREAGLDPERPPRSIAELEAYNAKLMKRDESGRLIACGHIPAEPGWWSPNWVYWFGGDLWDGAETITADSPENIEAYRWVQSYPERFGARDLMSFKDGFGNFASPQNPFFTGRVAMVLQGPWIYNFIKNYAPEDFEWGVAPFPSVNPELFPNVTLVESDILVIPAGAEHPDEAFAFIQFVNSQVEMEKLCLAQRKFSPLAETSAGFFEEHPNPYIGEFIDLAKSPQAKTLPGTTVWSLYANEMRQAFGSVWTQTATTEEVLSEVQIRMQENFDHRARRWKRMEETLLTEWEKP